MRLRGSKRDDVFDVSSWNIEKVKGGKGFDLVNLGDSLWLSDLDWDDGELIIRDRLSGQEIELKSIEAIQIGGHVFDVETLIEQLEDGETPILFSDGLATLKVNTTSPTPSVLWDQIAQSLVAETMAGPTNGARIYAMTHTAIYDAYAAHDPVALRVSIDIEGDNIETFAADAEDMEAAMHYAAHTVLTTLFPGHRDILDAVMEERLDLPLDEQDSPAVQIGMDAAQDVLRFRLEEAQRVSTAPEAAYTPVNPNPDQVTVIDAWTPEWKKHGDGTQLQKFLSPEFPLLEPFALPETADGLTDFAAIRPGGPEFFFLSGYEGSQLDIPNRTLTLSADAVIAGTFIAAGTTIPVTRDLIGEVINPGFLTEAENLVQASAELTDQDRIVAEFWEDGPGTSFPPGTMMTFAQFISVRDDHDAATDAQLFLAMSNAMFDAAIAAWETKVFYDSARPVQVIRDLGKLGLIGTQGVDELTGETGFVIEAFGGYDPETGASLGTRTVLAENFVTYQLPTGDFSPPFAEYVSGHSTYSGAAAAVLKAFTGGTEFGASTIVPSFGSHFDPTFPVDPVTMAWADFDAAAHEAGMSRIFGGIHFDAGNIDGLALGAGIGENAADLAYQFANGTATEQDRPFWDLYPV